MQSQDRQKNKIYTKEHEIMDPITESIIKRDKSKQIASLRKKISKWQEKKPACEKFYDPIVCISRLNNMIHNAEIRIKKLQGKK